MSEIEYRWFDIRAKFKLVPWDDLKDNDQFYYCIKRHKSCDQHAAGPFIMVNAEQCLLRNPQGIELPFLKLKNGIQPMIPVGTELDNE